jgi:CheY-like chemotaxis protein
VKSTPGKGTCFSITLPLGKSHLREDEICLVKPELLLKPVEHSGQVPSMLPELFNHKDQQALISALPLILVVEDNPDMRHYITHNLDHQFGFIQAENGLKGFDTAIRTIPDLIITDLMMPGMDGYELCRKIREDERTRHIPIIMLTAKAGKENFLSGYECGVDDYVIKPFDRELMLARIHNLLRERRLLREKFSKSWAGAGKELPPDTLDEKFIKKINEILEKNYTNPDFGPRLFIQESGMSRSVLFRKLKAITNLAPNIYLRNFRLLKAFQLISLGEMDISSAAYSVGFNNLSYFSRSFRTLFNKSPHEIFAKNKV